MVAGLTNGRAKYAHVAEEMRIVAHRAGILAGELTALVGRDASAFEALTAAYKQPKGTDEAASFRAAAIERAILPATEAPLEIARAAASVAELAASVAERGNTNAVADAATAALIAEAVCRAAALTVRVNMAGCRDTPGAVALRERATGFASAAARAAVRAVTAAEHA
jgi:glutamate formiminotransferase/formiminotetrahydrofolate cyclodeaminase